MSGGGDALFTCTVNEIGPAADGVETPNPVIYMNLTDTGGSFINHWFYAAENSKAQMLSVGLAAMSTNRQVEAAIDSPHVQYSSVARMYLLGPGAGDEIIAYSKFGASSDYRIWNNHRSYRHQRLRKD
jgi:hypothetical protein